MKYRIATAASASLACAGMPSPAMADDPSPPWWRGSDGTIRAEWDFRAAPTDWSFMPPDSLGYVPSGSSFRLYEGLWTHAAVDLTSDWMWLTGDGDGALTPAPGTGSASIAFKLRGEVPPLISKSVRLQVTWGGAVLPSTVGMTGYRGGSGLPGMFIGSAIIDSHHFYEDWEFRPSTEWDLVVLRVPEGTLLDAVVVDSWNLLPAPGGALVIGVAGAWMNRRRC